jgi:hypothetical protein
MHPDLWLKIKPQPEAAFFCRRVMPDYGCQKAKFVLYCAGL